MNYTEMLLSALSQGVIYAPMALGVYVAFRILHTPDLTIDGSFVFAMTVCAYFTIAGHPVIGILLGTIFGAVAGLITGILQTQLKINPILSGILTMTGLYTINYMVLGGQSNQYLQSIITNDKGLSTPQSSQTIFRLFGTSLAPEQYVLIISTVILIVVLILVAVFFKTRTGMAIRATGDNEEMVLSSSINADVSRTFGIMLANALVGLSGALLCQQQRYADIGSGHGMLVVGLASVIIGQTFFGRKGVTLGLIASIVGSIAYRIILQFSYQLNMPSYSVKLLSALIVIIALTIPLITKKIGAARLRNQGKAGEPT